MPRNNTVSEAQIHFELYYQLRNRFPELQVIPEYRIRKPHTRGTLKVDLYIPALRLLIECKNHQRFAKREVDQLHEYQALTQTRDYELFYCKAMIDVAPTLERIAALCRTRNIPLSENRNS